MFSTSIILDDISYSVVGRAHPRSTCVRLRFDVSTRAFRLTYPPRASHTTLSRFIESHYDWCQKQIRHHPPSPYSWREGGTIPMEGIPHTVGIHPGRGIICRDHHILAGCDPAFLNVDSLIM